MKKFIKNNIAYVVILGLLLVFILCILLFGSGGKKTESSGDVKSWLKDTASSEYVVTVLAQTTCGHCIAFKPVMESVKEANGFTLYWFEMDSIYKKNQADYKTIEETYQLTDYEGTPYTFITKDGNVVAYLSGQREKAALEEFLKTNNVIK